MVEARFSEPYSDSGDVLVGDWKREELWAPFLDDWRYGPSQWAPRRVAAEGNGRGFRDGRIC